jgi:hypothetical protein
MEKCRSAVTISSERRGRALEEGRLNEIFVSREDVQGQEGRRREETRRQRPFGQH